MSDKIFIDSNIWLYAIIKSQDNKKSDTAAHLIENSSHIVLTTQVVNEVAINLIKKAGVTEVFILYPNQPTSQQIQSSTWPSKTARYT